MADIALLLDWMTVHGQAVRVLPTQRGVAASIDVQTHSLVALGEPPAVSSLAYDRAVLRLGIQQMQSREELLNQQARRFISQSPLQRH